jgi:hypothetical protein
MGQGQSEVVQDFDPESGFPSGIEIGRRLGRNGAFECSVDGERGLVLKVVPCGSELEERRFAHEAEAVRRLSSMLGGLMRVEPFCAAVRLRAGGSVARVGCYVVDHFVETLDAVRPEYAREWEGEIRAQLGAMFPTAEVDSAVVGVYHSPRGPKLFPLRGAICSDAKK